ncbi:oxidoreductase NAD-binding domain-containing protein 1 isoform X2 [Dromiciops gliroides]|uniref:oxidoreductase NAD-binding domain-containing protein 1 isoform X2 n=1 Tax=Dromiciops gliroides TaxID=33562 RepID=UPI001CC7A126|nr:oxidoreductase NAD-binding domain-containing protein 1 isoform X2 [Dromiciops gliroides]XP_043824809.1 oxidoreductase NAD-binding domain-containing protein 1 isoform X2 [Dromiciops gliroides]XP_043824810.1 oxidoreductase NAD-binding domain-containing protein 1 isoform X2 [Dromiciops gliroides]XP_043824811.1 oxidoreductase NAD-binding domain-containing protein 1 isoform X2 [Dromiciops gliroides]
MDGRELKEYPGAKSLPSEMVVSPAKVCGIIKESETVRRLRLLITNKDFTFKAGQWVDFFIPGVPVVGGFSICSSPSLLKQESALELAVKYTSHPPSLWVHTKCVLGSEVALRVGGELFFDPQPSDSSVNLVLIAGGVGINPLNSILLHVADLHRQRESKGSGYEMGTVNLLYSAKNTGELLFKKSLLNLTNAFPGKIMCSFYVTQQTTEISEELLPYVTEGRISNKDLEKHISDERTSFFICGPPPMIEQFSHHLEACKVPKEHICFEKWW